MIFFVVTVIFFFNFTRLHAPLSAAVLRHGGPVYKWKAQSIMDQRAWVVTTRSIDVTRLLWEAPAEGLYIYNQQQPNNNNKKKEVIYPPNYLHLLFHPTPASIRWDQSGTFLWLFFCTVLEDKFWLGRNVRLEEVRHFYSFLFL